MWNRTVDSSISWLIRRARVQARVQAVGGAGHVNSECTCIRKLADAYIAQGNEVEEEEED